MTSIRPALLVRLMRLVGFKAARAAYWAPDPTILHDRESCKAVLLFASQPDRDELPAVEFLRLVELIYKSHYQRWYERTMPAESSDATKRSRTSFFKRSEPGLQRTNGSC